MQLTARTPVGRLGLSVPKLAFGTAPLATARSWDVGERLSEAQSRDVLRYAFDQGITWFDTAPMYSQGMVESRVGQVLPLLPRSAITVATKVGYDIDGTEIRHDFSRSGVLRSLEGSFRRLGVENVDIVHIHDPDHHVRQVLDETFPTLVELRSAGVIKAIGAGMNQWQVPFELARSADFDCFLIAGRWTLLEQEALPLLNVCFEKGIAVFAAGIYNSGILATGTRDPHARYNYAAPPSNILERVRAIERLCESYDVPIHTAATQYAFMHPAVKALVVGFQTPFEVQACLDAFNQTIPVELWHQLQQQGLLRSDLPLPKA